MYSHKVRRFCIRFSSWLLQNSNFTLLYYTGKTLFRSTSREQKVTLSYFSITANLIFKRFLLIVIIFLRWGIEYTLIKIGFNYFVKCD